MRVLYKLDIEKLKNLQFELHTYVHIKTALGLKRLAIDARAGSLYQVEKKSSR